MMKVIRGQSNRENYSVPWYEMTYTNISEMFKMKYSTHGILDGVKKTA